jgi:hypothetical protein
MTPSLFLIFVAPHNLAYQVGRLTYEESLKGRSWTL